MTQTHQRPRAIVAVILAALSLTVSSQFSRAAEPQPAAGVARNAQQVILESNQNGPAVREALGERGNLSDAAKRAEIAPKAIPVMRKQVALLEELMRIEPAAVDDAGPERLYFLSMLSVLGEKEATDTLAKLAGSADAADAASGKAQQLLVRWWAADKDAAGQGKVIDELAALAKQYPKEDSLARLAIMLAQEGPADKALTERAHEVILSDLKGDVAVATAEMIRADRIRLALLNKPLVIKGTTVDGKPFSTEQWKGKVVLVDFWATWCVPCLEELPKVKKLYREHRPKGLEIVGVSSDRSKPALENFLLGDGEMAWPQLFDAAAAAEKEMHGLSKQNGVSGYPTMFLIDRKGVVRSVDAGPELEELIPKLLAE